MRFTRIHWKLKFFLVTSYPVKMTSPHSSFRWKSRSWVYLSAKKILVGLEQPAACWIYDKTPYFSNFNLWKEEFRWSNTFFYFFHSPIGFIVSTYSIYVEISLKIFETFKQIDFKRFLTHKNLNNIKFRIRRSFFVKWLFLKFGITPRQTIIWQKRSMYNFFIIRSNKQL